MTAVEILPDLYFIERGYLNGNHFIQRSDPPALIDTGYLGGLGQTIGAMTDLGVDPAGVGLIVNTHTHCDHIGANRFIQERSNCRIRLHKIGQHFIETRDDWSTWWKYYRQEAQFFDCADPLEDGDRIMVGPHEFQVIHTPGHSADGLVFYHPAEKILISADTLWENDLPVVTVRVEGSACVFHYLNSLEKLEKLDIKMVFPGHGPPFADAARAIARTQKRLSRYLVHRERIGEDQLKRIIVYTVMMKKTVEADSFFDWLMETGWFRETIDLYFGGEYETKYREVMDELLEKKVLFLAMGIIWANVKA